MEGCDYIEKREVSKDEKFDLENMKDCSKDGKYALRD